MTFTPEQLRERREWIGGSECAAALGVSKWKTARQLYHEKRGEWPIAEEHEESEEQWWGRMLEPIVRQKYADVTGRTVLVPSGPIRSAKYPWMAANLDGYTEDPRGYEGKTAMYSTGWGEEGSDQIPLDYLYQVHHYLIVTEFPVFDVTTLIGRRFAYYEVTPDRELHEMIIEAEEDFMRRVREGDPPDLDYEHRSAQHVIRKMYRGTNGVRLVAEKGLVECRTAWENAIAAAKKASAEAEAAKCRLLDHMGDASLLAFPDGKCLRRKEVTREGYAVESATYIDCRLINDPDAPKRPRSKGA